MVLPFISFDTNGGAMGLLSISKICLSNVFSGNERSFQFKTSKTRLFSMEKTFGCFCFLVRNKLTQLGLEMRGPFFSKDLLSNVPSPAPEMGPWFGWHWQVVLGI